MKTKLSDMPQSPFPRLVADAASRDWGFNCGPGALAGLLHYTPEAIRPHLLDFETKGYTNPSMMKAILRGIGVEFEEAYRSDEWALLPEVKFGLVRVQWGGDWTRIGVPMKARYRKTHWVAIRGGFIFDVNAAQWLQGEVWDQKLVPWLCEECVPGWDGLYWATHVFEVKQKCDKCVTTALIRNFSRQRRVSSASGRTRPSQCHALP